MQRSWNTSSTVQLRPTIQHKLDEFLRGRHDLDFKPLHPPTAEVHRSKSYISPASPGHESRRHRFRQSAKRDCPR